MLKLLLTYGADPRAKNNDGKTPLDVVDGQDDAQKQEKTAILRSGAGCDDG